jgi:hypothetical protein
MAHPKPDLSASAGVGITTRKGRAKRTRLREDAPIRSIAIDYTAPRSRAVSLRSALEVDDQRVVTFHRWRGSACLTFRVLRTTYL